MGFLSPWFLGGLLAVGVPLYVHLLRQHKTVPLPFSSLMFFEKRTQSSVKHRRLKYIALLLLRLAIILLLALMFANPFVKRSAGAAGDGKKLLVVAVDNSFSMRAADRLGKARQEAKNALGQMSNGDTAQVVSFASNVQFLTQPIEDRGQLSAAVDAIQSGDGKSAFGELARTLRTIAPKNGLPVEVHIISDMQRTSMPSPFSELALSPNTRLVLHPVASGAEPNLYVQSVNVPRSVFQASKIRVQTTVASASAAPASTSVSVLLNGKTVESKNVSLAPGGRSTLEFFLPDANYGANRGEVRLAGQDRLPADDSFPFALERKEASRALFVHEARNSRALNYFRTAIESARDVGFTIDGVASDAAGNISPDKYAFVVVSDVVALPENFEKALVAYVRRGGSAFVALGGVGASRGKVPVANLAVKDARYSARGGERFQAAGDVDLTHPTVSRVERFENVKFYQTVNVEPGDSNVVARMTDATPLLLEKSLGQGRVLVFASTLDGIANDLPLHASFLPFVEQTAMYLTGLDTSSPDFVVDSFLELRSKRDAGTSVEIVNPDGQRALTLKEAASAQAFRLAREGYYEVRRGNGRNEVIAVHANRQESNLDVVPEETLALWRNMGAINQPGAGGNAAEERPLRLWWYFALALLIAALAESFFASQYLNREEAVPMVRKRAA